MQLEGITAPPIGAACTGGIACSDDPGVIARDHLAELTRGRGVVCTMSEAPRKAKTARCTMDGIDLSCAMVADGMAKSKMPLSCPPPPPGTELNETARKVGSLSMLRFWVPVYLVVVNIVTFGAFALDRTRATLGMNRVSPAHLLSLTFFGGGIGGLLAQWRLDHLRDEQPFSSQFAIMIGLQLGVLVGFLLF